MESRISKFSALDAWRGLAAVAVVFHHFNIAGTFHDWPIVRNAYLFVDFFFVLSGFVISHAYAHRLEGLKDIADFWWRRFARLWPLHAAMLFLLIGCESAAVLAESLLGIGFPRPPFSGLFDPAAIWSNLVFVHGLGVHDEPTWNFPSWSISVEMFTYLLFALAWVGFERVRVGLSGRVASLVAVALGALLVVALFSRVGMDATAGLGFPRCIAGFMLGAALRLLWGAFRGTDRPIRRFGTLLECVSLLLVLAFVVLLERTWMVFLAPLVFCVPVYLFACEAGAISRFLKRAPFQSVGQWSYAIYMVHAPFILVVTQLAKAAGKYLGLATFITIYHGGEPETLMSFASPAAMDGVALVFCAVIVAMAALCHRYVELPWQTRLNRLWPGKAAPGPSLPEPDGAPRGAYVG